MSFADLPVQRVQHNRPQVQRVSTADLPPSPHNGMIHDGRNSSLTSNASSTSSPPTVIRWSTPPSRLRSPQHSDDDRLSEEDTPTTSIGSLHTVEAPARIVLSDDSPSTRSPDKRAKSAATPQGSVASRGNIMADLEITPSPPTPIDATPYIRFAIDQITRDQDVRAMQQHRRPGTAETTDSYPVERIVPDLGLGYMATRGRASQVEVVAKKHRSSPPLETRSTTDEETLRRHQSSPESLAPINGTLFKYNPTPPLPYPTQHQQKASDASVSQFFIPVDPPATSRYPELTFVPTILRPLSMSVLAILCLLMIAALIFCAVYSAHHDGFTKWNGIYGAKYFLFGFLPQILAAIIFIYVQEIMAATMRMLPFTMMAMDKTESRLDALFLGIFPRTMLWPNLDGPISIKIASVFFWLAIFTIPLQSCLFSVVLKAGCWHWTAVQGVAWALAVLYLLILVATLVTGLFFFHRKTGIIWEPRSLADLIALLPRSNSLKDYGGTDVMVSKKAIKEKLALRSDRLGYWRTRDRTQGNFYCIGEEGTATRRYTLERGAAQEKNSKEEDYSSDAEMVDGVYNISTWFRYVPWYLEDNWVILWPVAMFFTLIALLVVSFLPSTALHKGFSPLVPAAPNSSGFSSSNFLWSFIPSILGMLLYLFFRPLDMAVRTLQPWAELGNIEGATAEESLLLDYAACLPVECTLSALKAKHYRVALLSLSSLLFILLPVLAGGLFFPLTTSDLHIRMIPNLAAFYIVIALLVGYLAGLVALIPGRRQMHFPHAVDCLAEIFSFLHASSLLDHAAFRAPRSRADLVARLSVQRGDATTGAGAIGPQRFAFGPYRGANGRDCLGVEILSGYDPRR